ncbi:MAG: RIP metalloprotease, partial [Candidatus Omnitrophica bacterium]|nr:RIP metalloprotease [Candidatus Omnitrophota bacterium]
SKSPGQRALIVLMGPVVNLILAYVCFWCMFVIGFVDMDLSSKNVPALVGDVVYHSPAQQAGLMKGDKIVSVDGKKIERWSDLLEAVTLSKKSSLMMTLKRKDVLMNVLVLPQEMHQKDIFGRDHMIRRIGVAPSPMNDAKGITVTRYGFFGSFLKAAEELWTITVKTYVGLYEMIIGVHSPKEMMGIVGMFFVVKFALTIGFSYVLYIVGLISASLAIFNLLPLVPLDGGHLFFIGLEKLRGKPLSVKTEDFIVKAGFTLIMILALFVFYADFERAGWIDKFIKLFTGKAS